MDHYAGTKARLFKQKLGKICVLPRDCAYFDLFQKQAGTEAITFSMSQDADYVATHVETKNDGMEITINELKTQNSKLKTLLVGVFNAENILAAYSILRTIGIETKPIQKAWENFTGVPGRMEPVPNNLGLTILVDYAHTETSLRSVLETLKKNKQRIIIVFGATGDRDTTKRPKMGAVVHELSDIIIVTDDDTYTESSQRIIDMVTQ
jgi:UDP-N-acetylmuramoyl-L-alanyl-D-glutamate--2,6-diaminopimelate ligase